jgi:ketosteroid isomerase-like protein
MNENDVRAFYDDLAAGEFTALGERLAEDVWFDFPGSRFGARVEGRRKVVVFLRQNQRLFDGGLRFDVSWVGVCGDRAIAQWTNAGRTNTGIDYANRGISVFHVSDGAITGIEDYLDTETLAATWPQ